MKKLCKSVALCSAALIGANEMEGLSKGTELELRQMNEKKVKENRNKKNPLFGAKTKILKNGLEIIVVEDVGIPRISIGVLYKVGCCDDPENIFGISHMTEHMFFHGSKKYPTYSKIVADIGGDTNAMTSEDFTMYIVDCPSDALDLVLDIEADRMANFLLTDEKIFQKERNAVLEERLMRIENRPLGLAIEYINNCLSPQHPYGKDSGGMRHNILAYSREAIMEHYKKWYKPNNALLIVVGAVKAEDVFSKAEKNFGNIKRGNVPKRERVKNAITKELYHTIQYYSDKVESEKIILLYNNAPHHSEGLAKCLAFNIGLDTLFDGVVFEFCRYFMNKKALVSEFDDVYEYRTLNPKPFILQISLMPNIKKERFLKEFEKKIVKTVKNGIKKEEFERAKKGKITYLTYRACDGHRKIREEFIDLAVGLTIDDIEYVKEIIDSITLEQVNAVLKEVFEKKPDAIVKISPSTSS
ncbi:MAG: insulinase family protein [Holosporales bacterium]|jgi:zinc protease|nr:insulinase family protein [Holosporales bacterium]